MKKVFVHRHKWRHKNRRRRLRRALKLGEVKLIEENKDGWLYSVPSRMIIP